MTQMTQKKPTRRGAVAMQPGWRFSKSRRPAFDGYEAACKFWAGMELLRVAQ